MATYRNLRYCYVKHDGSYYDVMVGVNNLDEVNDILQEWALAHSDIGEQLSLPEALIQNLDARTVNLVAKNIDEFVYVKDASTGYQDAARNAGISDTSLILPEILVSGEYVLPATTAYLWNTATFSGVFGNYNIASAGFPLIDDSVNYIGIDYNSGSPLYAIYTSQSSFNYSSIIPVCAVMYFNSELNVIPFGLTGFGLPEKNLSKQVLREEFKIVDNFTLAESTRYVELSTLKISNGVTTIDCLSMDTETVNNDMWLWYKDATSTWQKTLANQINNTQYQGAGTGLQSLGIGEFVINYLFRVIDDTNLLMFNVLSGSFTTSAEAKESDMLTDLPDIIKEGAILVGRMIVERDSTTPIVQKLQRINPFATV